MKKNKLVYSRGEKFSLQNEKKKAVKIEMEQKDEENKGKKNTTKYNKLIHNKIKAHPDCTPPSSVLGGATKAYKDRAKAF